MTRRETFALPSGQWIREGQAVTALKVWDDVLEHPELVNEPAYREFLTASMASRTLRDLLFFMVTETWEVAVRTGFRMGMFYTEGDQNVYLPEGIETDIPMVMQGSAADVDLMSARMTGEASRPPNAERLANAVAVLERLASASIEGALRANILAVMGGLLWTAGDRESAEINLRLGLANERGHELCSLLLLIIERTPVPVWIRVREWKENN